MLFPCISNEALSELLLFPEFCPIKSLLEKKTTNQSRRRKSRTAFTAHQLSELEKVFRKQKYLTPSDRDRIAKFLNLSSPQVRIEVLCCNVLKQNGSWLPLNSLQPYRVNLSRKVMTSFWATIAAPRKCPDLSSRSESRFHQYVWDKDLLLLRFIAKSSALLSF